MRHAPFMSMTVILAAASLLSTWTGRLAHGALYVLLNIALVWKGVQEV